MPMPQQATQETVTSGAKEDRLDDGIEEQFRAEVLAVQANLRQVEPYGFPKVTPLDRTERTDRMENYMVGVHARRVREELPDEVLVEWSAPRAFQTRLHWIAAGVAERISPQEISLFEERRLTGHDVEHARSRMSLAGAEHADEEPADDEPADDEPHAGEDVELKVLGARGDGKYENPMDDPAYPGDVYMALAQLGGPALSYLDAGEKWKSKYNITFPQWVLTRKLGEASGQGAAKKPRTGVAASAGASPASTTPSER